MKIMLDCSPKKIKEYSEKYDFDFWQLRTPLTNYALSGKPYGLDNGCFKQFNEKAWLRLVDEARETEPVFVTLPDVVGDARRTLELFKIYLHATNCLPRALVLQDGIGSVDIDWKYVNAVFVGGSDDFKLSREAMAACKTAKMLGKWVHVGRVNTVQRAEYWLDIADSIDGSGLSKYDHMLEPVINLIAGKSQQMDLLDFD